MPIEIRDVYAANLDEEFRLISETIDGYPLIGLDTEYPGAPMAAAEGSSKYERLKANVDATKLIQVGLSLSDANGNPPPHGVAWQFNFREFDPAGDLSSSCARAASTSPPTRPRGSGTSSCRERGAGHVPGRLRLRVPGQDSARVPGGVLGVGGGVFPGEV